MLMRRITPSVLLLALTALAFSIARAADLVQPPELEQARALTAPQVQLDPPALAPAPELGLQVDPDPLSPPDAAAGAGDGEAPVPDTGTSGADTGETTDRAPQPKVRPPSGTAPVPPPPTTSAPLRVQTVTKQPSRPSAKEASFLTDTVRACLATALGTDRVASILSGQTVPTPDETAAANVCFPSAPTYTYTLTALPRETTTCLAQILGDRWQPRAPVRIDDLEELRRARSCFSIPEVPFAPLPVLLLPPETLACLSDAVGPETFTSIATGRREPTAAMRAQAHACFGLLEERSLDILPRPPEEVPFLNSEVSTISIDRVETVDEAIAARRIVPRIVFTGRAPAGAIVDLYLFSVNPIVVSLATDENGVWFYRLDQPLNEGPHRGYAVVKLADREPVRSLAFPFAVARAAATGTRESGLIVQSEFPETSRRFLNSALLILGMGIGLLVLLYALRRLRPQER